MFAPAFTSGLAHDAVPASSANLPPLACAAGRVAAASLSLAATVLIFQGCVSEELT